MTATQRLDEDSARLAELGYTSEFSREMSLRANFAFAAGLNLAWPRTPDVAWYDNWIVVLSTVVVLAGGLLYMLAARPWEKSTAAAGDAVKGGE